MDTHLGSNVKRAVAAAALGLAVTAATAGVAQAGYYDSRYTCHPVGSFGKWYAHGFDNRGNHDYTGPRRTFKTSARSDCVDWLSVT